MKRSEREPGTVIPQEQMGGVTHAVLQTPDPKHRQSSRAVEIFLRKGRGLTENQIADELGISINTVKNHSYTERNRRGEICTMDIIVSMVNEGYIAPTQLTEGLDFDRYSSLTDREREILDLMSQEDMWDMGAKEIAYKLGITLQTVKNHLASVLSRLGAKNRIQAIIYNLFMPEEYRARKQEDETKCDEPEREITDRELQVLTLKARGFTNMQIGTELGISEQTIKNHVTRVLSKYSYETTINAIAILIGNGKIDTSLLSGELDFSRYDLLTDKEKRLLKTLANSRDANANKTLAYEYNVTVQAVKNEFSNIFVKLGARNRIQAAVFEFLRPKPEGESGEEANSLLPEVQDVFVEEITA